jgi:pyridoxamine 5'-phosphate oxidase
MPLRLSDAFMARIAGARLLPEPLPSDPFPTLFSWNNEENAARRTPNPNAITLATIDPDGLPSARIVLCRGIDPVAGFVTFFTNYTSQKSNSIIQNPTAAMVFHWDASERQARVVGRVTKATTQESDAYFNNRKWESRLSAWASDQSQPIGSRAELLAKVTGVVEKLNLDPEALLRHGDEIDIPRPPHWGGWRLYAQSVELWLGGPGRLHDRARWQRTLLPTADGFFKGADWSVTRLQP